MNVYVESNFVLELVLEQEQQAACEELVALADTKAIRLAVPAYALLEPSSALDRRVSEWNRLGSEVDHQLHQLRRSGALAREIAGLTGLMTKATREAQKRHDEIHTRLLASATVLPVGLETLREAERLRVDTKLLLPDAVMLAAVLADTTGAPSVFLNRNSRDFDDPAVRAELRGRGCDYIGNFEHGLERVRAHLRAQ